MEEMMKLNPFRLGFGLMRLPKLEDGSIDIPQVCEMTDRFIEAGGTDFDTAYVYDNGASEVAFRAADCIQCGQCEGACGFYVFPDPALRKRGYIQISEKAFRLLC